MQVLALRGNIVANRIIAISVTLTTGYVPVSDSNLPADVDVFSLSANADAYVLGSDGSTDVILKPGQTRTFKNIDLNKLQVKGTAGNVLTVFGNQPEQSR